MPNTTLLRQILDGIASGEYAHYQQCFIKTLSCGTARCIAGWTLFLTKGDQNYEEKELPLNGVNQVFIDGIYLSGAAIWNKAQRILDLSCQEADILFDGNTCVQNQRALLEWLEAGCRINSEQDFDSWIKTKDILDIDYLERLLGFSSEDGEFAADDDDEIEDDDELEDNSPPGFDYVFMRSQLDDPKHNSTQRDPGRD